MPSCTWRRNPRGSFHRFPEEFIQTNFVGTFRLLFEANIYRKTKPNFRFLHVSTDEVYGSLGAEDPAFCETTPYAPNSPYSASKAGSDFLARAFHHTYGMDVVTTNCSNNYGPYQFPEKLIPLMVRKVLRGESLPVYGDGTNVRDWLYVEDHCRGLFLALLKGRAGETYCIGGRCEQQNIQVVHELIAAVHTHQAPEQRKTAEDIITYVKDRPGHDRRYAINCDKISTELGWAPKENFASGLAKTVAWYVRIRSGWTPSSKGLTKASDWERKFVQGVISELSPAAARSSLRC